MDETKSRLKEILAEPEGLMLARWLFLFHSFTYETL